MWLGDTPSWSRVGATLPVWFPPNHRSQGFPNTRIHPDIWQFCQFHTRLLQQRRRRARLVLQWQWQLNNIRQTLPNGPTRKKTVLSGYPFTFDEFNAYLASFDDATLTAWRERGLPENKSDLESWWQDVAVSDQLRSRWIRRIQSKETLFLRATITHSEAA